MFNRLIQAAITLLVIYVVFMVLNIGLSPLIKTVAVLIAAAYVLFGTRERLNRP